MSCQWLTWKCHANERQKFLVIQIIYSSLLCPMDKRFGIADNHVKLFCRLFLGRNCKHLQDLDIVSKYDGCSLLHASVVLIYTQKTQVFYLYYITTSLKNLLFRETYHEWCMHSLVEERKTIISNSKVTGFK